LAVALLLATAGQALATGGERELAPVGGVVVQTDGAYEGVRLGGEAMWALSDFWAVGATAAWTGGTYAGGDGSLVWFGSALGRARLTIDALTWVPALFVGFGFSALPEDAWLQYQAGAEVAYRSRRDGAWFGQLVLEGPALRPGSFAGLAVGYRWISSAAGDLDF